MTELAAKQGIKETKEVIEAVLEISLKLTAILKDGYQSSDIMQILQIFTEDKLIRQKLSDAYQGLSKIKDESKDIDFAEGFELFQAMAMYVPKFVEVIKKDAK